MTDEKNIINFSVYEIDKYTQLHTYTATWCNPCKKIKPIVIEIMDIHNYKCIFEQQLDKIVFKKEINEFVPFFMIMKNSEKIDHIQTSDQDLFKKFLSRNDVGKIEINEDF